MMLYRMLMRLVGPWRIRLTRLHWWCWRKLVARRFPLPRTNVRSLSDQGDLNIAARNDYASKIAAQRAITQPGEPDTAPYVPATTWAQFEAEVRERAAKLQGERA
jgi:hypothetical protein